MLYFYLLYWPYISEDIFRKKDKDILPKGWRDVLLPILEDSIGFNWFSGWELQCNYWAYILSTFSNIVSREIETVGELIWVWMVLG